MGRRKHRSSAEYAFARGQQTAGRSKKRVVLSWVAVFSATLIVQNAAAEKVQEGFPVIVAERSAAKGVTLADLDSDGKQDVIVVTGEGYMVIGGDGKTWDGYPKVLRESTDKAKNNFNNAPAVCDVDGDGRLDVVLAGTNKHLYAVRADGAYLSGFPVKLDGEPKGAITCVPVKDTKAHELALVTDTGSLLQVSYRGGQARKVASVAAGAESGVAVSDLDGDGRMDYVLVGGDSRVRVINANGKVDSKVDYRMAYRVSGTPSLGDIDDDGQPEIVLASQDFKIHAVRLNGESVEGFPYETGYRLYGSAALADMDRDGVLDVVVGSGDRRVHVINGKGKSFDGFPAKVNGRISAEVAVGDLDFDGKPEIAAVTERGSIFV
ncbi:MAG: VCBS repeat-containing protein, partial [Myxococcota bacterium]